MVLKYGALTVGMVPYIRVVIRGYWISLYLPCILPDLSNGAHLAFIRLIGLYTVLTFALQCTVVLVIWSCASTGLWGIVLHSWGYGAIIINRPQQSAIA